MLSLGEIALRRRTERPIMPIQTMDAIPNTALS